MTPVTDRSFGILIAYLIPGFLVVWVLGQESAVLSQWLAFNGELAPTVGGFLYVTVASLGVGLGLSTLRWAIIDQIHHHSGIPAPTWDFRRLQQNIDAYRTAVDLHYRYYQFYGGTLIANLVILCAVSLEYADIAGALIVAMIVTSALFFIASRDALAKYYRRTQALIPIPTSLQKENDDDQRRRPPRESVHGDRTTGRFGRRNG